MIEVSLMTDGGVLSCSNKIELAWQTLSLPERGLMIINRLIVTSKQDNSFVCHTLFTSGCK